MKPLIEYKKPWASFEDQLAKLKQRGLFISDEEKALNSLQRMGYYRLSGYFHSLKQRCEPCCLLDDSDNLMVQKGLKTHETVVKNQVTNFFKQGTQFQDAVHLYVFDKKLRLLALDGLERIEVGLRVDIAHQLGKRGAYSYLDPSCLARHFTQELDPKSNTTKFVDWLSHQARQVGRSKEEFIVAYNAKYYQPVPIWIACELWDFGTLSKLFSGMLPDDQRIIANRYGLTDPKVMISWIRSLNYLRNVCAHHSRLWNRNMTEQPKKPQIGEALLFESAWSDARVLARPFIELCLIQFFLQTINPTSRWWKRLTLLLNSDFPDLKHLGIDLSAIGIIDGWEEWDWVTITRNKKPLSSITTSG